MICAAWRSIFLLFSGFDNNSAGVCLSLVPHLLQTNTPTHLELATQKISILFEFRDPVTPSDSSHKQS